MLRPRPPPGSGSERDEAADVTTRNVHFVGSVKLEDNTSVFTALAEHVGARAARYTDGETSERSNWLAWQVKVFEAHPNFELNPGGARVDERTGQPIAPKFRLRDGVDAGELRFEPLGYANVALDSYAEFVRLRREGVVPSGVRFQVSLPTPLAVISAFVVEEHAPLVEPAYDGAMRREVEAMLAGIEHADLAIQWDVCLELTAYDGGRSLYEADPLTHATATVSQMIAVTPPHVDVGVHLCYGDAGHKHIIEPQDLGSSVIFANSINAAAPRPLDWAHMAVPRDRDDSAYFAPLADLHHDESELVLGLIHFTDGLEGALDRMEAAGEFATDFGVATECGFGRRLVDTVVPLLQLHAAVADSIGTDREQSRPPPMDS